MTAIVPLQEFLTSQDNTEICGCWLCQKQVSPKALFCHHCGTIQPVREIDHFVRLGVERIVDLDSELLDRQYQLLKRTLDPSRFASHGLGERGHAAAQLEALEEAYNILRDPVERGRYWMFIHTMERGEIEKRTDALEALQQALEQADGTVACDRIAQQTGHALQSGIRDFLQALRDGEWEMAHNALAELDGLESILLDVREKRSNLAGPTPKIDA